MIKLLTGLYSIMTKNLQAIWYSVLICHQWHRRHVSY